MSRATLRVATRGSVLARAQATGIATLVESTLGVPAELVAVSTTGDRDRSALTVIGGEGVFVGAVREAVASGAADLAVHSLKDLPTYDDPDVVLAAVPLRTEPRDALIARDRLTLATLPPRSVVGTGSPRRAARLRALRPDLEVVAVRGNVDTRIALVATGQLDAVVLAAAGLVRLARTAEISEYFDPESMLPAPGQGALAVEVARGRADLAAEVAAALDDPTTRAVVTAERAVLRGLSAGCSAPVGALAEVSEEQLWLRAEVSAIDGGQSVRLEAHGPPGDAEQLGRGLARSLLDSGAADLTREPVP